MTASDRILCLLVDVSAGCRCLEASLRDVGQRWRGPASSWLVESPLLWLLFFDRLDVARARCKTPGEQDTGTLIVP